MYCKECGHEYGTDEKYCIKCGKSLDSNYGGTGEGGRWYHRLGMVIYVFFNLLLLPVVFAVWSESSKTYVSDGGYGYNYHYEYDYVMGLWYSFLTVVVWLLVLRLIKIALRYIATGRKFQFKDLLFF